MMSAVWVSRNGWNPRRTLHGGPAFVESHVQRVFQEQRIHRLHGLRHGDGAGGVELVVAVNRDVDLFAHRIAGVLISAPRLAQIVAVQSIGEPGRRRPKRASP
jgi:hypothetical protein